MYEYRQEYLEAHNKKDENDKKDERKIKTNEKEKQNKTVHMEC